MSHIFDALQRSEAERSGNDRAMTAAATELLERAERQAARQWRSESNSEDHGADTAAEIASRAGLYALETDAAEASNGAAPSQALERVSALSQCRTLQLAPAPDARLVCLTETESPASEAFRLLGVRVRHLRKDRALKKLLVTSTVPREGKSFASANLACVLASASRQKTLLLEGDLRRPALSHMFGVAGGPGVCEYLQGTRGLSSSICHLEKSNLWILPAGVAVGNPLDVMQSAKLPSMMEQLSSWFDWIIIDSPPVLPLADTSVWARLADGILLVARPGITEKKRMQRGIEALEPSKLIGTLLNSSHSSPDSDYAYYRNAPSSADTSES
ncbi:MAG: CpsD/CapB family tyrosine-protein kinase [Acidobacteriaceae bacterium]